MAISRDTVVNAVKTLITNFSIKMELAELTDYTDLITGVMITENISEDLFNFAVYKYIKNTKGTNFNKLPSVGDFMAILNIADDNVEDTARIQSHVVKTANINRKKVIFDDAITNYVIKNEFGGLREIDTSTDFFGHRFVKAYMSASKQGLYSTDLLEYYNPIDPETREFFKYDDILVIGNFKRIRNKEDYDNCALIEQDYNIGKKEDVKSIDFKEIKQLSGE